MPLDVLYTSDRITRDPMGREFVDHLRSSADRLGLDDAALYYDFPTYSDYETVSHKPDALLVSRHHGVVAIRFIDVDDPSQLAPGNLIPVDESLGQFCSILIGHLLKSRLLRHDRAKLLFSVTPVLYMASVSTPLPELESATVGSLEGFDTLLEHLVVDPLSNEALAETRSVVEGAKALTRPQRRRIDDPVTQGPAAALAKLEAEIANFDQRQRRAALVAIAGPQRIRGLAGSGKTVILAMKAATLHLNDPDAQILVTFYTRSLRATITNLITRFFRHYRDEDPDWNRIHVRHGWGGTTIPGVYSDACWRANRVPLSYGGARQSAPALVDPFDFACRELLQTRAVEPYYDHVLIDEGQDFPSGFYELCFALAKGDRDRKSIVWAYDELQNILDVKIRSPEDLFGRDEDGQPRVSLERAARNLPPEVTNDTVLSKCYRNQREVLVTAHALGFGIYGTIVQLLESREHWEDVGYEVASGTLRVGEEVRILRPAENSPLSLDQAQAGKTIDWHVAASAADETAWIVAGIREFLVGGLQPEDIIVIALDDRNARMNFTTLSSQLAHHGIETNNIIADPYTEPPFSLPGKVTLSTVYRAKGNEAAVVFALGVDAISPRTRSGRNKLFTAFTRAKAWLRVSGFGGGAASICKELEAAMQYFPYLVFTMPDLHQVELIQRDLSQRSVRAKKIRDEYVGRLREEGFSEDEIADILSVDVKNG